MVLQEEEMATPGDSDSPLAENEAPSPSPSAQTTEEVKDMAAGMDMPEGPGEDEMLPGMVPDEMGEAPEAAADMPPADPEEAEEPAAVSEEVVPETEAAPEMESMENAEESMPEEAGEETIVKELVGKAEDMVDEVHTGAKNAMQSIGGKITDFIGGNMRKVKSLLHLNEKAPDVEDMLKDEAKALSSSTGDLAQAVKKSKACTIL